MAKIQQDDAGELTITSDLQGGQFRMPEVEVDSITEIHSDQPERRPRVLVRMNTTLEDFTYGNPNIHYKLEMGKRYEMPDHIASYLDGLGYLWH